jgi:hypothetical protein
MAPQIKQKTDFKGGGVAVINPEKMQRVWFVH